LAAEIIGASLLPGDSDMFHVLGRAFTVIRLNIAPKYALI